MRNSNVGNPVQLFTVSEIRTNVVELDLSQVIAIRINAAAAYTLNGVQATMPAGATAFASNLGSITFNAPQTVEVML